MQLKSGSTVEVIEKLRKELHNAIEDETCLFCPRVVKLSKKLDELLNNYYETEVK